MSLEPPALVIYWADTRQCLTHSERRLMEGEAVLVCLTPQEVLIRSDRLKRAVVVRRAGDPHSPAVPARRP